MCLIIFAMRKDSYKMKKKFISRLYSGVNKTYIPVSVIHGLN